MAHPHGRNLALSERLQALRGRLGGTAFRSLGRVTVIAGQSIPPGASANESESGYAGKQAAASNGMRFGGRRHGVDVTPFSTNLKPRMAPGDVMGFTIL
jgi:hypothetical protein